jgi:hypothetical protein
MQPAFPIRYVDPVFRPPSEADSLILPVTDGCSWNHCSFCEMYTAPQKKFRARDAAETLETLRRCGERFGDSIRRVFLADGDALVLPTRRLLEILAAIREHLPAVRRVSSYCLPRNLRKKSVDELKELAAAGLAMAYVGAESGDDEVLAKVNKGETFATTLRGARQAAAGRHPAFGNDPQRARRQDPVKAARREFRATGQCHAARIPGHAGGEFSAGRRTLSRRISGMAALQISASCSWKWKPLSRRWNSGARCSAATTFPTAWY